jgi:hypothetical protein
MAGLITGIVALPLDIAFAIGKANVTDTFIEALDKGKIIARGRKEGINYWSFVFSFCAIPKFLQNIRLD